MSYPSPSDKEPDGQGPKARDPETKTKDLSDVRSAANGQPRMPGGRHQKGMVATMTDTTPEPEAPDIRVTAYIGKGGDGWEAWTYPGIGTLSVSGGTEDATKEAMVQAYNALEDTQWAADQFSWESGE